MEEGIDFKNLSLEEKCTHKIWKVRLNGYEECIKYYNSSPENGSTNFGKFENLLKTFCLDPNAVALDKALEAVLAIIKNYPISSRTVTDVAEVIVTKSFPASKKSTQEKATNVLLMCCEIEKFPLVQDELLKGFTHKNPKVVSGCVHTLTLAMREFGQNAVDIKLILKSVNSLFEQRDKIVRNEAKIMIVEMYHWIGEDILSELTSLKPVILQELKIEFKKMGIKRATPKKLFKSETKSEKLKSTEVKVAEVEVEQAETKFDEKVLQEINILEKLPADFFEKIESKKWQDRKEMLEALFPFNENVKLASGDYYYLVMALTKVIGKDTNVVLVALAGNCLTGIAKGLQKQFSSYAAGCLKTILGKFKDRKQNVLTSLRETADAIFRTVNIDSIRDITLPFLMDKNPNVKHETASFLTRCFCRCTPKMLNRKILKCYSAPMVKALNDPDPHVRDSVAEALGTAMKVVGEPAMGPFLDGVDRFKLQKIRDCSEKAQIQVRTTVKNKITMENNVDVEQPSKNIQTAQNHSSRDRLVQLDEKQLERGDQDISIKHSTENVQALNSNKVSSCKNAVSTNQMADCTARRKKSGPIPLLQKNYLKQVRVKNEERCTTMKWEFTDSREDLIIQLRCQMHSAAVKEDLIMHMFHPDSKFHLKCIEELHKDLNNNIDACVSNLDLILRWITICFFDTNTSVILKSIDYLKQVFERLSDINYFLLDFEAQSFLPYLIMIFGHPKDLVRASALNIMHIICNIYPSSKISPLIIERFKSNNSQQRASCLECFGSLVEKIGMVVCQPNPASALKDVTKLLGDEDGPVVTSAINILSQVYKIEQDKLFKYIGTLPNEYMLLLQKRIRDVTNGKWNLLVSPHSPQPQIICHAEKVNNDPLVCISANNLASMKIASPLEDTETFKSKFKADYDFLEKILKEDSGNLASKIPGNISPLINNTEESSVRKSNLPIGDDAKMNNDNIEIIISQISDSDYKTAHDAISQLEELIRLKKYEIFFPFVNQLLITIAMQYKQSLKYHEGDESVLIFQSLTTFLMNVFKEKELATAASPNSLYDVCHSILNIIVYSNLCQLEGGIAVIRNLNNLVILMIQTADYTKIFSALIKLLHHGVESDANGKFTELAMKCTWKAIRALPSRQTELDLTEILRKLTEFMIAFPLNSWCDRTSNKPLRTIKTLLHSLVETFGRQTLQHLNEISDYKCCELEKYIIKLINAQNGTEESCDITLRYSDVPDASISTVIVPKIPSTDN